MSLHLSVNHGSLSPSTEDNLQEKMLSDLVVTNTGSGDLYLYFHDTGLGTDSGHLAIPAGETRNVPPPPFPKAGWFKVGSSAGTTYETTYWVYTE